MDKVLMWTYYVDKVKAITQLQWKSVACGQWSSVLTQTLVVFEHVIPCIINMDIISSTVDKVLM